MKLIIQIPCYNEEATLGVALDALPRSVPGVDVVEWLVVDDGSTDRTAEVARGHGADHVVRFRANRGLASAFMAGLDACITRGADIIVNTDADNQYNAGDIPALIAPILRGEAEIVVGARPINEIQHWSMLKKLLQKAGSWVVRMASRTNVPDAPSGFRAMTRDAALRLNVFGEYTYTLETIIQAGRKNMAITSVPVRTNPDLRPSRLIHSIPAYLRRSLFTIARILMTYRPFRFFAIPGAGLFLLGTLPALRFLYFYSQGYGNGHIQSLLFGILFMGTGAALVVVGLLADLVGVNRQLLEEVRWRLRRMELRLQEERTEGEKGEAQQAGGETQGR
ncbi:MAG: glycosyltransferase family 2 protein [Candidatus Hydrogenedentes bacterium]|nr:glycosyltransferase family 2 protein [Candidatus Hydrogenedentota bacterium]